MFDTVEMAQKVLDERGYLVVSSNTQLDIGQVVDDVDWSADRAIRDIRPIQLVVIAETDRADFAAQARAAGWEQWLRPDDWPLYYRVTAE